MYEILINKTIDKVKQILEEEMLEDRLNLSLDVIVVAEVSTGKPKTFAYNLIDRMIDTSVEMKSDDNTKYRDMGAVVDSYLKNQEWEYDSNKKFKLSTDSYIVGSLAHRIDEITKE